VSYILTAWNEAAEMTIRTDDAGIVAEKAEQLVAEGWRVSVVETSTGESLTVAELQQGGAHAPEIAKTKT